MKKEKLQLQQLNNGYNHNVNNSYKFYPIISMIYITLMLSANVLIYKLINIFGFTMTVGSLITPLWFIIGDTVTEVYGYNECRKLIWMTFLCSALFSIICYLMISIPSPTIYNQHQLDFDFVLGKLPQIFFISMLGIFIGSFINAFVISRLKIMVHGKYLWLRLLGSSCSGQFIFTLITLLLNLIHKVSTHELYEIIMVSFIIKLLVLTIIAYPLCFLINFLKKNEEIDVYDYTTDFNPFKLR